MNLQKQLRRLEMLAGDRDTRGVTEVLDELARNDGWSGDVEAFIERMGSSQRAFVEDVIDSQQPDFDDIPGPGDQQGGIPMGLLAPASNPMAGVTRDATSGWYCPANAAEWAITMAAAGIASGGPSSCWPMQEAAGNLVDAIGSLTLTAAGTGLGYLANIPGWTRKGVSFTDVSTGHFTAGVGVGPDPSATSVLWGGYADITAQPIAVRTIVQAGGAAAATECVAQVTSTSLIRCKDTTNTADGAGNVVTPGVIPVMLQLDRTNLACRVYTDVDKVTATYAAGVTDGNKGFGAGQANSPAALMAFSFMFSGAAAQLTTAQIKTLLQTLGPTVTWS